MSLAECDVMTGYSKDKGHRGMTTVMIQEEEMVAQDRGTIESLQGDTMRRLTMDVKYYCGNALSLRRNGLGCSFWHGDWYVTFFDWPAHDCIDFCVRDPNSLVAVYLESKAINVGFPLWYVSPKKTADLLWLIVPF
jgi:hypothetical protein